jgi:hypothetical protein
MKQIFRASLVVLTLAGMYAGFSTPAPAMNNPQSAIITSGIDPTPSTPTTGGGSGGKGGVNSVKVQ